MAADRCGACLAEPPVFDAAERGYNQAWELARRVARAHGLPADDTLLLRPVETAHQTGQSRAGRAANLARAFMAEPSAPRRAGRPARWRCSTTS
jgi:predicted amidophosphoribosyltransferase